MVETQVLGQFRLLDSSGAFDYVYTQYSSTIGVHCQFLLLTLGNYLAGRPVVMGYSLLFAWSSASFSRLLWEILFKS